MTAKTTPAIEHAPRGGQSLPMCPRRVACRPNASVILQVCLGGVTLPAAAQERLQVTPTIVTIEASANDFDYFTHFAASARGLLAVAQQRDGSVIIFARNGTRQASFGRKGEGPGEFKALNALGWVGDTLWVLDNRLRRVTHLSSQGKLLRTDQVPTTLRPGGGRQDVTTLHAPRTVAVYPDGSLLMRAIELVPAPAGASIQSKRVQGWLLKVGLSGVVERVIAREPTDLCHLRTGTAEMFIPLCPQPLVAVAPDGGRVAFVTMVVDGENSSYVVKVISNSGGTVYTQKFPADAELVPKATRDTILTELRNGDPVFKEMVGTIRIGTHFPPVTRVELAANGDVWIGLASKRGATLRAWQLIDHDGRDHGRIWIPRESSPSAPELRGMWSTFLTADGLESIRLYAKPTSAPLPPPPGSN